MLTEFWFIIQYEICDALKSTAMQQQKKKSQGIEFGARNNAGLVTGHYENLGAGFQQVTAAHNTTFSTSHGTSILLLFATRVHLNHH